MEQTQATSSTPNSASAPPSTARGLADAIIARNTPEPKKREPQAESQPPKQKAKPQPQAESDADDGDAADEAPRARVDEPTDDEAREAASADSDTTESESKASEADTTDQGEEQTEKSDSESDESEPADADAEDEQQQDDPAARYTVKIGDKEAKVSLSQLKSGYMMQQDYARKTQELSKNRKELVAHQQESVKIHESKLQELGFLAQTLMQELVSEDANTNWEELRASDPTEFAARFASREQKREKLGKSYKAYQEHQKRAAEIEQHNRKIKLGEQAELLFTAIPEWLDQSAAKRGVNEIGSYLAKRGYAPDEARNIIDHRDLVSHYKAMLYDRMQQNVQSAKTKIKQAPVLVRKGGSQNTSAVSNAAVQATKTFQKTGKPNDFAAALLARGQRRATAR